MTEQNLTRTQTELFETHPLPSSVLHNGNQMRAAYTRLAARRAVQSVSRLIRNTLRGRHGLQNPLMHKA